MSENLVRSKKDFWFACVDIEVIRDKTLSTTAKYVFTVICSFASINNRSCFPSVKAIAKASGVSDRTVQNALKELKDRGVILAEARKTPNGQITSRYKIIGYNAECYKDSTGGEADCTLRGEEFCADPVKSVSPGTKQENDIIYSYEGSGVPSSENTSTHAEAETQTQSQACTGKNQDSNTNADVHEVAEAPEIMRSTAELLLYKTGRKGLSEGEINALRELARNQVPARVQKEIDTAVERFKRQDRDLKTLRFEYIASALANQPTRGKAATKQERERIRQETQEFDAVQVVENIVTDEELDALMAEVCGGK